MTIDRIFSTIGELGPAQLKYCFIIGLSALHNAWYMVHYTFIGQNIRFQCRLSDNSFLASTCPEKGVQGCEVVAFETQFATSISSEWKLVCENAWKSPMTMTLYMVGVMAGAVVLGSTSDRIGRKTTFIYSLVATIIVNALSSQVESFLLYCLLKFFCGFFVCGIILSSFVLQNELIGSSWRGVIGVLNQAFFAVGIVTFSWTAYYIRDWRHLTLVTSLLGCALLVIVFYLPESPHWLLSQGQLKAASKVLHTIAIKNGAAWDDKLLSDHKPTTANKSTDSPNNILRLFTNRYLTAITLIQIYSWFVNGACYYGLTLAASSNSKSNEDKYFSTAMSGFVELPAYAITLVTLARSGRKRNIIGFMFIGSAALFSIFAFGDVPFMVSGAVLMGKLCISSSFAVIYVHSSEVFATSIRNSGMGIVSVAARLGGAISPFFARLGDIHPNSHFLLFAVMILTGGWLNSRLPETKGLSLPETVGDMIERTRGSSDCKQKESNLEGAYSRIYDKEQGTVM